MKKSLAFKSIALITVSMTIASAVSAQKHEEAIVQAVAVLKKNGSSSAPQFGGMPNAMIIEPLLTDKQPKVDATFDHYRLADGMICIVPDSSFAFKTPVYRGLNFQGGPKSLETREK